MDATELIPLGSEKGTENLPEMDFSRGIFDPIPNVDLPLFLCTKCLGTWGDVDGLLKAGEDIWARLSRDFREKQKVPPLWICRHCEGTWCHVGILGEFEELSMM